jgi:hypothetical protein
MGGAGQGRLLADNVGRQAGVCVCVWGGGHGTAGLEQCTCWQFLDTRPSDAAEQLGNGGTRDMTMLQYRHFAWWVAHCTGSTVQRALGKDCCEQPWYMLAAHRWQGVSMAHAVLLSFIIWLQPLRSVAIAPGQ